MPCCSALPQITIRKRRFYSVFLNDGKLQEIFQISSTALQPYLEKLIDMVTQAQACCCSPKFYTYQFLKESIFHRDHLWSSRELQAKPQFLSEIGLHLRFIQMSVKSFKNALEFMLAEFLSDFRATLTFLFAYQIHFFIE